MQATKHPKTLSVRLPEGELRRLKSIAATRGVSVQDAVHQAIDIWIVLPPRKDRYEPLDALEGSLADVDLEALKREERDLESAKDGRWL